jgi:U3 small nucleolar RNA-associated protein 12
LPVLGFDVSSDGTLLVSCSADKNIKLWGMDFGDIHKSIFAHQDSITAVQFVKGTHYFLSCSKDRTVKYWDGDTYEEIFVFDTFFAEVWSLAVSSVGDFFVAVSADKSIRVWR